ncbi:MAG: ABC transporter substrate-binding protein [Chloroflexi bacterium]|nr:ABC transporter substrate-binding protein [Chloroflexota bacterium]
MRAIVHLAIPIVVVLALLVACAPAAPTAAPTKPSAPAAPTAAPKAAATAPAAPTSAPAVKIKRGGTLRVGTGAEWTPNADPIQNDQSGSGSFEGLFSTFAKFVRDPKTKKFDVKPNLAESWETPDPKTLILKLRKGVTFHDGSPWNAEAARWNIDRWKNHKKSGAKQDVAIIDSMTVVDDYTLKLNLKAPPAGLMAVMSDGAIRTWVISKETAEKMGDDSIARNPVGAGPFKFAEWKTNDSMTLKRYDKYWEMGEDGQPLPYLDSVVYRVIKDNSVRAIELKTGNIDFANSNMLAKDIPGLAATPSLQKVEMDWQGDASYFFFNSEKEPFGKNKALRQALQYAIDRESLAKTMAPGLGKPAYYHWAASMIGYDETLPKYDYQPEKAKQLMAQAGYPDGVDVSVVILQGEIANKVGEILKSMFEKIGVRLTLDIRERAAAIAAWESGNFEFGLSGKPLGEIDPNMLNNRFMTDMNKNYGRTHNAELDKCFEEGMQTIDEAKRAEIYKRCQKLIFEDAYFGLTHWTPNDRWVNKRVKGWDIRFGGDLRLAGIWLE